MDVLDRLLGHDHWATVQLLELSRILTDEQLDQPFDIGHRTLRATFEHMIFNVEFWTGVMAGQPVDAPRDGSPLA
ncbi:MAG: DinB family protein, partial [Chloroflexia bacterium]|nr:DinB family protein [Chloroflexia bacterium]